MVACPLVFGIFLHPALVAGLLPGALISGVQLAISMSNTGGAWDNCKKFIESGNYVNANGEEKGKGSEEHKASVIGDTIGDPLKDTSGPSLNILIKLMAIISLVFAGGFDHTSWFAGLRARVIKAPYRARETKAADPIANPFPTAAVVFPAESRASVISLMEDPNSAISEIPPALSEMGP